MPGYADKETLQANLQNLADNPYPGRGLVLGLNQTGEMALQAYWVMGRSENSRNRLLAAADNVVRTVPYDEAKVEDPSLIIYNAMRTAGDIHVVSNGDQTDTAVDFLARGDSLEDAMQTRLYEPDAPNYTPRITGTTDVRQPEQPQFSISVIRKIAVSDLPVRAFFGTSRLASQPLEPIEGLGHCLHTYKGDGDPLPAFDGAPYSLPTGEGVEDTAELYWQSLAADNRVALVVKGIHLATRDYSYHIINAHEA